MDAEIAVEYLHKSEEMTRISPGKIRILVVDDDYSDLLSTINTLRKFMNYEVSGVNDPVEAISTLRKSRDLFDLIMADYDMPLMSGIELQRLIREEFNLPVIMMSTDDKGYVMQRSVECGAAFFIQKPVKAVDCQNLGQYALVRSNKGSSVTAPANRLSNMGLPLPVAASTMTAMSMANDLSHPKMPINFNEIENDLKRKLPPVDEADAARKRKFKWNDTFHTRFVQAVDIIGIDRATPKKIHELMNDPDVTRQNVASHLQQKYRIWRKKYSEEEKRSIPPPIMGSSNVLPTRDPRTFYASQPPPIPNSLSRGEYHPAHPIMNQVRTPLLQQGLPWSSTNSNFLRVNLFPSQEPDYNLNSRAMFGQQVFGTAHDHALRYQPGIPSFVKDPQNNTANDLISGRWATNDHFTSHGSMTPNDPVLQNQSMQASLNPNNPDSMRREIIFGNYSGTRASAGFSGNVYPSHPSYGNPHTSQGTAVCTNEGGQLNGANQQLGGGTNDCSSRLTDPAAGSNQMKGGEGGQPDQINPTVNATTLRENCYTTLLSDEEVFDILVEMPNLEEATLLTPALIEYPSDNKHQLLAKDNAFQDFEVLVDMEMPINDGFLDYILATFPPCSLPSPPRQEI
ncbi:hypothetical protein SAY86_005897 [Trapa natans]|uniref:Response regulatory domain-containing protein n=1 Tax=Trapa natans TaxID=22666 RepID=A0AAN7L490_TRANT|nr:hypothetical protein SAY86_005897 [Trapa natans]